MQLGSKRGKPGSTGEGNDEEGGQPEQSAVTAIAFVPDGSCDTTGRLEMDL